jgi:hypothetical protein
MEGCAVERKRIVTNNFGFFVISLLLIGMSLFQPDAQAGESKAEAVTVDNFIRAESDLYFSGVLKESGGILGKFNHHREVAAIDNQTVIRLNRDTLYSSAVFDLAARPVTIRLPDAGKRFRSMQVVSQDHYVPMVVYAAGLYTLTRKKIGTRYALVGIRTLVDPNDPKDIQQVHALQDAIKVSQQGPGNFEVPSWDQASQKEGAGRAAGSRLNPTRLQARFRHESRSRSRAAPYRHRGGLGRQSRQGRHLP